MRRGRTGAIMPRASMSSVMVKKMKAAAARRPAGGLGISATSVPTSSGSVISGSGMVTGCGGFCGESAMTLRASLRESCGRYLDISALIPSPASLETQRSRHEIQAVGVTGFAPPGHSHASASCRRAA